MRPPRPCSEASPVLVTGGNSGVVRVFRLVGVECPEDPAEEQRKRLVGAMASNVAPQ